jgi:hypothetical protein
MAKLEDGAYRAEYRGFFGDGAAQFEKRGDSIIGNDLVGAQYFGTCREVDTDRYRFELDLHIGVPSTLVTDGKIHDAGEHIPIRLDLSADDLGRTINVNLPNGPLQLTIDRVGELPTA